MRTLWDDGIGHTISCDAEGDYHITSFAGAEHVIGGAAIEKMPEFKAFDDILCDPTKGVDPTDNAFNIFLQAVEHKFGEPTETESVYDRARERYKDSQIYGQY